VKSTGRHAAELGYDVTFLPDARTAARSAVSRRSSGPAGDAPGHLVVSRGMIAERTPSSPSTPSCTAPRTGSTSTCPSWSSASCPGTRPPTADAARAKLGAPAAQVDALYRSYIHAHGRPLDRRMRRSVHQHMARGRHCRSRCGRSDCASSCMSGSPARNRSHRHHRPHRITPVRTTFDSMASVHVDCEAFGRVGSATMATADGRHPSVTAPRPR
jgi:hypothetical protein